jgi:DNA-binding NarL/FixJ family response regulator
MAHTRVLIVDDHPAVRKGIQMFLSTDPDVQVVGEAENGEDALRQARNQEPDVILIDLLMPGGAGVEAIAEIKRRIPDVKVIVLTTYSDESSVTASVRAGADGFLLKDADGGQLLQAIQAVQRGNTPLDRRVAHVFRAVARDEDRTEYRALTEREKEVLKLVVRGLNNQAIAHELDLSQDTVKTHLKNIFSKLGVSDRTGAAVQAVQLGLILLSEDE